MNTIKAVKQNCYYLKGKNNTISPVSYCHLRGMTANLIVWGGFVSFMPALTFIPSREKLYQGLVFAVEEDMELEEDGELVSKEDMEL